MRRDELLKVAAKMHAATIASNREPNEELSVRDAARLIREVDRRAGMTGERADYYDGIIPKEKKRKKKGGKKR